MVDDKYPDFLISSEQNKQNGAQKDNSAEIDSMLDVYAGPEYYESKFTSIDTPMQAVYAGPDFFRPAPLDDNPIMQAVYAGPDFFQPRQGGPIGAVLSTDDYQKATQYFKQPVQSPENAGVRHFCTCCGAPLYGGKFCSECGAPVQEA